MRDPADELLVAATLRGDRAAFARLVDRHRPRAHALARRLLGDAAEAEPADGSALELLPEARRELLLMRYVDGLSAGEIGARVGRSAGAVRVELHRARSQLRELLRKEIPMVETLIENVLIRGGREVFDPTARHVILLRE